MQKVLLLLTIFILGCNSESPTIQSTNLTGLEIHDYVDQRVWEFMSEKEGMTSISIVYRSKFRTPEGV